MRHLVLFGACALTAVLVLSAAATADSSLATKPVTWPSDYASDRVAAGSLASGEDLTGQLADAKSQLAVARQYGDPKEVLAALSNLAEVQGQMGRQRVLQAKCTGLGRPNALFQYARFRCAVLLESGSTLTLWIAPVDRTRYKVQGRI
jgi:hypothetical protein